MLVAGAGVVLVPLNALVELYYYVVEMMVMMKNTKKDYTCRCDCIIKNENHTSIEIYCTGRVLLWTKQLTRERIIVQSALEGDGSLFTALSTFICSTSALKRRDRMQ